MKKLVLILYAVSILFGTVCTAQKVSAMAILSSETHVTQVPQESYLLMMTPLFPMTLAIPMSMEHNPTSMPPAKSGGGGCPKDSNCILMYYSQKQDATLSAAAGDIQAVLSKDSSPGHASEVSLKARPLDRDGPSSASLPTIVLRL